VTFHLRAFDPARRALGSLLTVALMSFAFACAAHVGVCDLSSSRPAAHGAMAMPAGEGCGNPHGCADRPARGCDQVASCCSTWAPAPVAPGVPHPPIAVATIPAQAAFLSPTAILAPTRIPIPAESPPPIVTVLRL
jgi:hypothetical protein